MALIGLAVRYIGGALDPDFHTWAYVLLAPLLGVITFLQASGRTSILAALLFGLGVGGLVFWIAVLTSGRLPITGRMDYVYVAFILAIPLVCVALAVRLWRRPRAASSDAVP